jgi:hypothetical protein
MAATEPGKRPNPQFASLLGWHFMQKRPVLPIYRAFNWDNALSLTPKSWTERTHQTWPSATAGFIGG